VNAPLRRIAIALLVLFALLFGNLNWVQFVKGGEYRRDDRNRRVVLQEYERQRGYIVVDDEAVAESQATGGKLKYQRIYPARGLYAPVTGYKSLLYGSSGIESDEDPVLSGDDDRLFVRRVSDIVTGRRPKGGNVVLTLSRPVQQAANTALGGRKGAVVALDPTTGAILGMVSAPTYDPNPLASHDTDKVQAAWKQLQGDPNRPLLNRALSETYPPGSTFKVVVTAGALADGADTTTELAGPSSYTAPQTTRAITNYEKGTGCGDGTPTLEIALTYSCNTAYARLGVELGVNQLREQSRSFGFEVEGLRVPMPVAPSRLGSIEDAPSLAQSSIGQRDVRMTPLQGAMIAATVANNGTLMRPHLVRELQSPDDFSTLDTTDPEPLDGTGISPEIAAKLQQMMRSVVDRGTGTAARVEGVVVGGKTGTAQNGGGRKDTTWFIGYAMVDDVPVAAVAVVLDQSGGSSADAAAVAGRVLKAAVESRGRR